jgi:hypothetical protein
VRVAGAQYETETTGGNDINLARCASVAIPVGLVLSGITFASAGQSRALLSLALPLYFLRAWVGSSAVHAAS